MSPKQQIQKLSETKTTSVVGGLSMLGGVLLTFVPADVRSTCTDAIMSSDNPVVIGSLFTLGTICTLIGPSLLNKK